MKSIKTKLILTGIFLLSLSFLSCSSLKYSKQKEKANTHRKVEHIDTPPKFLGSTPNLFSKWVETHLIYPKQSRLERKEGKVTTQFTVKKDGSIGNVKILKSVDPLLDQEAIRVIESSPKWSPGIKKGKKVNVTYTFPVIFRLKNKRNHLGNYRNRRK